VWGDLESPLNEKSTLSWSAVNKYENCAQDFLWSYGWGNIDLGRGPGRGKKKPPDPRSRHHAVMGITVQAVLEDMYNEEMWTDPKNLSINLLEKVEKEWSRQISKPRNNIDYDEAKMSEQDMLKVCRDGVVGYLRTMKAHKLLGTYARSEVNLVGWINKWTAVGGRSDFIIRREDTGVTILDGKNTQHKMLYTNPDQLRWYAMLFKLSYREFPDRLGFVWYRFPHGMDLRDEDGALVYEEGSDTPKIEEGIDWIEFTEDDLRGLAQRAVEARNSMRKEKFNPDPVPAKCDFCDWNSVCEARIAQRATNSEKRTRRRKIEELSGTVGFVDLEL
jgi:hypothetical protein